MYRILFVILLLKAFPLWTQPFHYEIFDTQDGILSSEIISLYQDQQGFLWVGTIAGLSKYDGYTFTNYTDAEGLTKDGVRGIVEDLDGTIWVATYRGISFWNGHQFQEVPYKKLIENSIWVIHRAPNGDIWVGTDAGISVLKAEKTHQAKTNFEVSAFHHFDTQVDVNAMASDTFGNVYLTDFDNLMVYDGMDFKILGEDKADAIMSIYPIGKDTVLVGNRKGGIHIMAKDYSRPYSPYLHDSADAFAILSHNNRLWIGDQNGIKIIKDGEQVYNHSLYKTEGIKILQCMIKDREHNFWLGSREGLIKMTPRDFTIHKNVTDSLKNGMFSLIENKEGELVIGGNQRKNYLKKEDDSFKKMNVPAHFPAGEVYDMLRDHRGDLWFLTFWTGIARYQSDTQVDTFFYEQGIKYGADFYCIFEDQDFNIWIGHTQGATRLTMDWQADTLKEVKNYSEEFGMGKAITRSIVQDQHGTLWLGTSQGLYYLKNDSIFPYEDLKTTIVDMVIDKDQSLWIATQGKGLLSYKITGDKTLELTKAYNKKNGLASNFLLSLAFNQKDEIWVGSYIGFSVLRRMDENYHIINYNQQDGIFDKAYQNISLFNDKHNTMWAATSMGLLSFDPTLMKTNQVEPIVHITEAEKIDGSKIPLTNFPVDSTLKLPYDENTLTFKFTGISLKNPSKIRYRYILEGLRDSWSSESYNREITFGDLDNGTYTLNVSACNNDRVWNAKPASFTFKIAPPFWETWWFITLSILVGIGIVAWIVIEYKNKQLNKQRIAYLKKEQETQQLKALIAGEEKERTRIGRELHDGLGATLATVKMQIDSISHKTPAIKHNSNYVKAEELIDEACQTVREISHRMTPYILEQHGLEYAINDMCQTINQTQDIQVYFNPYQIALIESDTINITIYRVTQELLKNIIKHAQAKEVIVQVTVEDNQIEVVVEDDGKGFDTNIVKGGIGLDNIRSRVEYLKGTLNIDSQINKGSTFIIHLPLN